MDATFDFDFAREATCPVCGNSYLKSRRNQHFCCKECANLYWKEYRKHYLRLYVPYKKLLATKCN